jgi:hypothetical protein
MAPEVISSVSWSLEAPRHVIQELLDLRHRCGAISIFGQAQPGPIIARDHLRDPRPLPEAAQDRLAP